MSEVFCIVQWVVFFDCFCWLWDFLLKNLKLKKNSDDVHWNAWKFKKTLMMSTGTCGNLKRLWWCPLERVGGYKKVVCPKKYFRKKKKFIYEILNHSYFGLNFVFWGTTLWRFSQYFFPIFRRPPAMLFDIFTHRKTVVAQLIEEIESNASLLFRVPLINSNKISPCSTEFTFVRKH